jgi:hypothetical protein
MDFSSPLVLNLQPRWWRNMIIINKQNGFIESNDVMKKDDDVIVPQMSMGVTTKVVHCYNMKPHCKRVKM